MEGRLDQSSAIVEIHGIGRPDCGKIPVDTLQDLMRVLSSRQTEMWNGFTKDLFQIRFIGVQLIIQLVWGHGCEIPMCGSVPAKANEGRIGLTNRLRI